MKKARKFLTLILCFAVAGSLFSCNTQTEKETSAPTESEALPETEEQTEAPTEKATKKQTEKKEEQKYLFSLKFGSYNIAAGRNVDLDFTVIGNDIKTQGLDIVGLQEVDQFTALSNNQDTMKILSESSGLPYSQFFKAIDYQGGEYGLAILSKYPILGYESEQLDSQGFEQRIWGHALIDVNGTHIDFFVTHLSYEDMALNALQTEALIEKVIQYENFVLTGDFNTSNFEAYYVDHKFGAVNNGAYKVPTFNSDTIDNIIYRREAWKFEKPLSLPNGHSDHNMIYATAHFIVK